MTLVDMDSVHFYRPPTKAGLPGDGQPTATINLVPSVGGDGKPPTTLGPSHELKETLRDDDLIEIIDMTAPSPRECLSPFHELVLDLQDIEPGAVDHSNKPWSFRDHVLIRSEEIDDFPTLEELLSNVGAMQEPERAGLSGERTAENLDTVRNDCDEFTSPESRRDENRAEPTVLEDDHSERSDIECAQRETGGSNSVHTSDRSTAEEQYESQDESLD